MTYTNVTTPLQLMEMIKDWLQLRERDSARWYVCDEVDSKPAHANPAYAAPRIVLLSIVCATRLKTVWRGLYFPRRVLAE
jgi:hypothetical protein